MSHEVQHPDPDDQAHDDHDHDHDHEHGPLAELVTVRDWLRYAVTRFNRSGIFCGHGVHDTYDEAVWLILGTLAWVAIGLFAAIISWMAGS